MRPREPAHKKEPPKPNNPNKNVEDQERYRQSVERQINDLTSRLERANQDKGALDADKRQLQSEINDLRAKLFDIEASYDAAKERADNLAAQLTAFSNQVDPEQLAQARALLTEFDFDGAEKILTQIVNDQELNVRQSAAAHYGLGEIAEERVNWQDALDHYKRAYGQDATLAHLWAYARLCWRMGRWEEALPLHKDILEQVAVESGKAGNEYATALNNLATIYQNTGRPDAAEPLFDQALSIHRRVLGDDHPDTATSLNNLAELYRAQGRYSEAAPLFKEAVEIMERVLGAEHPNTKIVRENYEGLLAKMKE